MKDKYEILLKLHSMSFKEFLQHSYRSYIVYRDQNMNSTKIIVCFIL